MGVFEFEIGLEKGQLYEGLVFLEFINDVLLLYGFVVDIT